EEGASGRGGEGARDTLTRSHWFLSRSPTPPLSLSLLGAQPHVLKPSVHPVAGHGLIVADACRAHLETRVPQTRDPPGLLDDLCLHLPDELDTLFLVQLDFLLCEQLISRWLTEAAHVVGGASGEFHQEFVGVRHGR